MRKIKLENSAPFIDRSFQLVGPYNKREVIEVDIILRSKDPVGLEEKSDNLQYTDKHMSSDEITAQFGPSAKDIKKIKLIAGFFKLKWWFYRDMDIDKSNWCVTLKGKIKIFNRLFGIQIDSYKHPVYPNRQFRAFTEDISIPKKLEGIVISVLGLDNLPIIQTPCKKNLVLSPEDVVDADSKPVFKPNELAEKYYSFPKDVHGKGQSIAIVICSKSGAGYKLEELEHYFKEVIGLPTVPNIEAVNVGIEENSPGKLFEDFEVYNDIEILGSIAYEADIFVYFTNNKFSGLEAALCEITSREENPHSIISISYAINECKWSPQQIIGLRQQFRKAALMGITVCVSSGDDGTLDGVTSPSSFKHVLACGGTMFTFNGDEPGIENIASETVWNEKIKLPEKFCEESGCESYKTDGDDCPDRKLLGGHHLASCGGESKRVSRPKYQQWIKPQPFDDPCNVTWKCDRWRKVPDVAGHSGLKAGYKLYLHGGLHAGGGTSAAAPLYAALFALINEALEKAGKQGAGFITRLLYNMEDDWKKKVFNDITTGNNDLYKLGFYNAVPGWDFCTGWGSINGQALLEYLLQYEPEPKKS